MADSMKDLADFDDREKQVERMQAILDLIGNKWTIMILAALCKKPLRFNALQRQLGQNITHKALTDALRRLERCGLLHRAAITKPSYSVEYSLSDLAESLQGPFQAMQDWVVRHAHMIEVAQGKFDKDL